MFGANPGGLEAGSVPLTSGFAAVQPGGERVQGAFDGGIPPLDGAAASAEQPAAKKKVAPLIAILLVVLAIVGMLGYQMYGKKPAAQPKKKAVAVKTAPKPKPKPKPKPVEPGTNGAAGVAADAGAAKKPETEEVGINVTSDPSGATVFVDGKKLGVTPLDAKIDRGEDEVTLRLAKEHYQAFEAQVIPFDDVHRSITLEPLKGFDPAAQLEKEQAAADKKKEKPKPRKVVHHKRHHHRRRHHHKSTTKKKEKKTSIPLLGVGSSDKKKKSTKKSELINPFN